MKAKLPKILVFIFCVAGLVRKVHLALFIPQTCPHFSPKIKPKILASSKAGRKYDSSNCAFIKKY
jgi:hypothetical protein